MKSEGTSGIYSICIVISEHGRQSLERYGISWLVKIIPEAAFIVPQ